MLDFITKPWPWYIAGPLIGLTVPALLIMGNKSFGISSSLRHACAACIPAGIPFFQYNWKKEAWNLFFVFGIFIGGIIASRYLVNANDIVISPALERELARYGITNFSNLVPLDILNWDTLFTLKGFILMVLGDSWWVSERGTPEAARAGTPSWGSPICRSPPLSLLFVL